MYTMTVANCVYICCSLCSIMVWNWRVSWWIKWKLLLFFVHRSCFISNEDSLSLTSFYKSAHAVHPEIRRSMITDPLWSQFIFNLGEKFCRQPNHARKKMVTCIGRPPGSNIWVFGPKLQFNQQGKHINTDFEEYYWLVHCYKSLLSCYTDNHSYLTFCTIYQIV